MKRIIYFALACSMSVASCFAQSDNITRVTVHNGILEGQYNSGIREFKGIPYAAPPVGPLRWKAPQPASNWSGIRQALQFGPRAMQLPVFGDMNFRSNGMSEDCLYLNVWTPARATSDKLPVLVYYYGGGFIAGDGSEPRYDGESMARKGIVTVTLNYRLGLFGFMAHPELTNESPQHASGNYGLLDQAFALKWVKENIAAFGGDPQRITIAGESAGSISVSIQTVSPLTKKLLAGAIGESGSVMKMMLSPTSLAEGEKKGLEFMQKTGAKDLAQLRGMSADELLKIPFSGFPLVVDGYLLTEQPEACFAKRQQAQVPMLIGWNSQEMSAGYLLGNATPTPENYKNAVERLFGSHAEQILKAYPATTDAEAEASATALASDKFIAFSTWKWTNLQAETSTQPVYRYYYARPRPAMRAEMGNAVAGLAGGITRNADAPKAPAATGAAHSAEIEYALGNLAGNRVYDWQTDDYKVSALMQAYFANFIKTGNPNGLALPQWTPVQKGTDAAVMHIDVNTRLETEKHRNRYLLLNTL